ncbi:MAG: ethanolamine utilization protein EutN [Acidobacteriia bacterium]|nr:ethanolamine utilization protein EutN [Terriglobia bacterium]MYB53574.1 ethanolamine utilization protein EutN [Terriglobia bacterium]MYC68165.1 ethanolamine utilization protein EutN [Terriglobia bacterium]MYG03545.1 ethanolamine utilization protein EutN [Terriglobia bacterium]MYK12273.1 ethanolamine utilization protein EutN [Terriglobia bacterium]
MILARVVGNVVATRKDARLEGKKLLVLQHLTPVGAPRDQYVVALDTVGAGDGERVLCVAGSSARMASGMKDTPVDTAIVGIVDEISMLPGES